jgi:hypothetical protein
LSAAREVQRQSARHRTPLQILLSGRAQENGGALTDSAIPARAPACADQGHLHGNCIEASYRWIRSRAWREPARILLRPTGRYEVPTNNGPRRSPAGLELRSNQRLYVPFGSPPSVAVGSAAARAAHRSRALQFVIAELRRQRIFSRGKQGKLRLTATDTVSPPGPGGPP